MIEKLLKNTGLSLRDGIHWVYEESDTSSYYISDDEYVTLKLGIDLTLSEKEFIKELIPIYKPVNTKYALIKEIYSNCIKFMCYTQNRNPDNVGIRGKMYFVSYEVLDFIKPWLVDRQSSTTQQDNFLELLRKGKSLFRVERNPFPTCPFYSLLFNNQH